MSCFHLITTGGLRKYTLENTVLYYPKPIKKQVAFYAKSAEPSETGQYLEGTQIPTN